MKSVKKVITSVVAVIGCVAFATSAFAFTEADQFEKDKETIAAYLFDNVHSHLADYTISQEDANALVSVLSENNVARMKQKIPTLKQKAIEAQEAVLADPGSVALILRDAASNINVGILGRVKTYAVDTDKGQLEFVGYVMGERGTSPDVTVLQPLSSVSRVPDTSSVAQDAELAAAVESNSAAVSALTKSSVTVK